jgi:L-ribulose-5-phosphate 3-epimerase
MIDVADRRRFIKSSAALAALAAFRPQLTLAGSPKIAVPISALRASLTILERFRLAADAGFSGVEMSTVDCPSEAEQVREAAERAGLRIHSVVNAACRRYPFSSADPDVVRRGVAGMETSLRNAWLWGADTVLVAPASAGPEASYRDAWNRSQQVIRERILPLARHLGIVLAIDEVWDGFILGPPEVARYVDAFASPWVKACFDTDRGVFYASHQDWIRTLGSRLVKVRAREGGAAWLAVTGALEEIAYEGWVTIEMAMAPRIFSERLLARLNAMLPK